MHLAHKWEAMRDCLKLAKLYGHDGIDAASPDNIEWDRRLVTLHADGTLWHADDDGGADDGEMGRVDLAGVVQCAFAKGTSDEICLSQEDGRNGGKCHLLRLDESSTTKIHEWHKAIFKLHAQVSRPL